MYQLISKLNNTLLWNPG